MLSETEEARALQYRCECLEAACLQQRESECFRDLCYYCPLKAAADVLSIDIDILEPLTLSSDSGPPGFGPWLDKHLLLHDSIIGRRRPQRESFEHIFNYSSSSSSYKCWDERCAHYIYGFRDRIDRDKHVRVHSAASKTNPSTFRDSAQSYNSTHPHQQNGFHSTLQLEAPKPYTPRLPRLTVPSDLPPLSASLQSARDRKQSRTPLLFSARPSRRNSVESDIEPQLPPLKRPRTGQPHAAQTRLESIEELHLLRERNPCLRCRILNTEVKSFVPASFSRFTPLTRMDSATPISRAPTAWSLKPPRMRIIGQHWDALAAQ